MDRHRLGVPVRLPDPCGRQEPARRALCMAQSVGTAAVEEVGILDEGEQGEEGVDARRRFPVGERATALQGRQSDPERMGKAGGGFGARTAGAKRRKASLP